MNLDALFYPKSIAIIGASTKEKTVGNDVVKNLVKQGYKGKIYPINPNANELYGVKVYHDISEVDSEIDLAVVAIPAKFVPSVMEVAATKGAKACIVISAGFKEAGNSELEEELKKVCQKHDIALVGPNCLGAINPEISMNASFAARMPDEGSVAFISQSGALCTSVIDYAKDINLGFSKFVSIGNKADVDELALIEYLAGDPKTRAVLIYAEQLTDSAKIISTVKKVTRGNNPKPIIVLKSGRTSAGASAIASHTGSLAGGDAAYEALFKQAGVIRANSVSQLFEYAQIFAKNDLSEVKKVAIITNAGGPGVLTTDEVVSNDLELAKFENKTEEALKAVLPPAANTHNPIDVLGDARADRYEQALKLAEKDPHVEGIIVVLTPQSMTEIEETAKAIAAVKKTTQKPIVVSFMGKDTVEPGVKILQSEGVATSIFPESAAKAMATLSKFVSWSKKTDGETFSYPDVDKSKVVDIFAKAKANGQKSFPEAEAMEIFKAYNFPLLKSAQAKTKDEAVSVAKEIGGKLAMKIISPDILHKSDVGGVMLNITKETVAEKFDEMMQRVSISKPEARLEGVLLMEMAPENGTEVILGANKDASLGHMIMFGLGGIYVEVFKDVTFGLAPITKDDAWRMVSEIRSSKIFDGVRGQSALDKEAIVECLGRLSQLLTDFPEIIELDVNPLMVLPKGNGVRVLDGRIVIE
ncbi:MAG: acetate--CoA ligase family protein [Patescibacteria group bacterium]|jgi:acetyl coenzyme A synthetase (ADP forming)-like protein